MYDATVKGHFFFMKQQGAVGNNWAFFICLCFWTGAVRIAEVFVLFPCHSERAA
jgi:hypothetical protein